MNDKKELENRIKSIIDTSKVIGESYTDYIIDSKNNNLTGINSMKCIDPTYQNYTVKIKFSDDIDFNKLENIVNQNKNYKFVKDDIGFVVYHRDFFNFKNMECLRFISAQKDTGYVTKYNKIKQASNILYQYLKK